MVIDDELQSGAEGDVGRVVRHRGVQRGGIRRVKVECHRRGDIGRAAGGSVAAAQETTAGIALRGETGGEWQREIPQELGVLHRHVQ